MTLLKIFNKINSMSVKEYIKIILFELGLLTNKLKLI